MSDRVDVREWREGVHYSEDLNADVFAFTLDKTSGQFSPTTRYRDYAISRELIRWESQSMRRESSPTGVARALLPALLCDREARQSQSQ